MIGRAALTPWKKEVSLDQQWRLQALARVSILDGLSQGALQQVATSCKWRRYEVGQHVLAYQDPSTDVHFLAAGCVRVIIHSPEGKAVVFTSLKTGAMFGEVAAIDRGPRSASVDALETSTVASLTADKFEDLLLREPSVALATLRQVTSEVRRLSERVLEFSTLVVQNRIQAELLRLATDVEHQNGQVILSPAPSLSDIADRISTHREAVSRELSRLASIGLLRREGGDMKITDLARLKSLVREAKGEDQSSWLGPS